MTTVGVGLPRSNRTLPQGRSSSPETPLALVVPRRPSGGRCPPLTISASHCASAWLASYGYLSTRHAPGALHSAVLAAESALPLELPVTSFFSCFWSQLKSHLRARPCLATAFSAIPPARCLPGPPGTTHFILHICWLSCSLSSSARKRDPPEQGQCHQASHSARAECAQSLSRGSHQHRSGCSEAGRGPLAAASCARRRGRPPHLCPSVARPAGPQLPLFISLFTGPQPPGCSIPLLPQGHGFLQHAALCHPVWGRWVALRAVGS